MMATQLAILKINNKQYYQDDRLQEYREVKNYMNRIPFDEIGDRKVKPVQPKKDLTTKKNNRLH